MCKLDEDFSCIVKGITRSELEVQGLKQLEFGFLYLGFLVTWIGNMHSEGKLMHILLLPSCWEWRTLDLSIEYYWQFIHRHVEININEEGTKFTWGKEEEDSFQQMKDTFSSNSVFQYREINHSCWLAAK
jgi:hypothetical protein